MEGPNRIVGPFSTYVKNKIVKEAKQRNTHGMFLLSIRAKGSSKSKGLP
jgi:hypothetical protein